MREFQPRPDPLAEMSARQDKRLPIAAFALGVVGLCTGGLLGVGALMGLALAVAGLSRTRQDPHRYGGRGLAWAAVAANVLGLLSLPFLLALGLGFWSRLARDNGLPAPMLGRSTPAAEAEPPAAPSPPPNMPLAHDGGAAVRNELQPIRIGVGVGGRIVEPRKLHHVPPVYPETALRARLQGIVVLECTISPDGRVTDIRVLSGVPLLHAAAVDAVKQWVYTPTLLEGKRVPVIMTVTVNFQLN